MLYLLSPPASNSGVHDKLSRAINMPFPGLQFNMLVRGQLMISGSDILV